MMKTGGPKALAIAALGDKEEMKNPKAAALRVAKIRIPAKQSI